MQSEFRLVVGFGFAVFTGTGVLTWVGGVTTVLSVGSADGETDGVGVSDFDVRSVDDGDGDAETEGDGDVAGVGVGVDSTICDCRQTQ